MELNLLTYYSITVLLNEHRIYRIQCEHTHIYKCVWLCVCVCLCGCVCVCVGVYVCMFLTTYFEKCLKNLAKIKHIYIPTTTHQGTLTCSTNRLLYSMFKCFIRHFIKPFYLLFCEEANVIEVCGISCHKGHPRYNKLAPCHFVKRHFVYPATCLICCSVYNHTSSTTQ